VPSRGPDSNACCAAARKTGGLGKMAVDAEMRYALAGGREGVLTRSVGVADAKDAARPQILLARTSRFQYGRREERVWRKGAPEALHRMMILQRESGSSAFSSSIRDL